MGVGGFTSFIPNWVKHKTVDAVNSIDPVRRFVSRRVINYYAYKTPPRPRAVSMAANYTTWPGLTDRRFSGRHLAPIDQTQTPVYPNIDDVVKLFERKTLKTANDTSILFPFFAQWFVDSFLRTKWEPPGDNRTFRENESNHEIDLCQIYGISEVQTKMLRECSSGRLRSQLLNNEIWPAPLFDEIDGQFELKKCYERIKEKDPFHPAIPGLYSPENLSRVLAVWPNSDKPFAFAVGLEHGNSTIGNALMNTLFLREHNRTADILHKAHPTWDPERVFQTARNVTIVVLINIVIGDYIVHIAPIDFQLEAFPGMAEKERWYRNNWMAVEFALLYRWHDLIPDEFVVQGDRLPSDRFRWANQWLVSKGLDDVLLEASRQPAGRIGLGNTARFLIDPPPNGSDVKKLSIEMARACGLPSFNAYRQHYGLSPVSSFEELTGEHTMAAKLRALYGQIDRLEWFVGLFAEGYAEDEMMGSLLTHMVANDAFTQALTNPLLAEAIFNEATFGPEGLAIVQETRTLADVIVRNTGIRDKSLVGFKLR